MVSERGLDVLRVIVHDYVASKEPVGSKRIVERHDFGVSAATIRNDMAALEEEELIAAPHTSSGRVPTDKGYRLFVDRLADVKPLTSAQRQAIEAFLGQSFDLDDVLARTVRLLSQLTHQVALVQYPSISRSRVRHVEFVILAPRRMLSVLIAETGAVEQRVLDTSHDLDAELVARMRTVINELTVDLPLADAAGALAGVEQRFHAADRETVRQVIDTLIDQIAANRQDKLVMAGAANLVRGEHDFTGSIYPVLEAIEEQVILLRLFGEMAADQHGVSVSIGRENASFGLAETSVLASGYASQAGSTARVGVLGPLRMDYSSNMAAVRAVARYLSRLFGES
ncbi:heat-inducible transcriptional repressor HrcA [Microbacterium sp. STN6]|uniref:heat-inducible transcriptional repressor HrcA n=1 Tax=Microbacterium sp. STN6 TaxID=2995588 RepID=UPI002260A3C2|nr:heat-inducible transcriptional repressor HrcA [Microbacterium sp. STN6]MCX7522305.1 heat-inducible transcriptional repressor HrcA [Microbacterium sp. STN6]